MFANPAVMWGSFLALVIGLLLLDFFVFQRRPHQVSTKEALAWTGVWVGLALLFDLYIYRELGRVKASEFLAGYIIEEALSIDNMFVFLVIFRYFAVPGALQHRVLFFGILGAMIMRGIFIGLGSILIGEFAWLLYIFGAFLLYTAWHLWRDNDDVVDVENTRVVRWGRKHLPLTESYVGERFFIRREAQLFVTPLLLVLLTIEFTDLVFAVDSIPAVFGITTDPFIVFTSNIFAIAGLRALYFVLAGMYDRFHYLRQGLALVLAFVGLKMLLGHQIAHALGHETFPVAVSLLVVAVLIFGSIGLSLLRPVAPTEVAEEPPFEAGPPM